MDIIVKTVLDLVQSQEGFENSVIAGGACRDYSLGIEPKDYDIFLPYCSGIAKMEFYHTLVDKLGIDKREKGRDYGGSSIRGVSEFTFEGKVFDLIFKDVKNDVDFGKNVVLDFDYGLNKAYYDGLSLCDDNEDFQSDLRNWRMTLLNLDNIDALPKVISKFNRVNDKLKEIGRGSLWFNNKCLVLNKQKETKRLWSYTSTTSGVGQRNARIAAAAPVNPVGEIPLAPWPAWEVQPRPMDLGQGAAPLRPADIRAIQREIERAEPVEWIRNEVQGQWVGPEGQVLNDAVAAALEEADARIDDLIDRGEFR